LRYKEIRAMSIDVILIVRLALVEAGYTTLRDHANT
jgi:hypothetical protein